MFPLDNKSQIVEDNNNNIWLGTQRDWRLYQAMTTQNNLRKVYYSTVEEYKYFSDLIYENSEWIFGLALDDKGLSFYLIPTSENIINRIKPWDGIKKIYEDDSGLLWIGTLELDLFAIIQKRNITTHYTFDPENEKSLSSNTVFAINQDNKGTLWIGTNTGLNKYEPSTHTFIHFTEKNGLANNLVLTVFRR